MKLFVTGTDTGIGKTTVSVTLLHNFKTLGYKTLGLKPIGTGAKWINGQLYHEDALALRAASTVQLDYQYHNPILFELPVAPQFAAAMANCTLSVSKMQHKLAYALNHPADITLLEGAGGWYVPLNDQETLADFVIKNRFTVLLVVGIRLGCLNHAILTYQALEHSGVDLMGWVANCLFPDSMNDPIVDALNKWLPIPMMGCLNHKKEWSALFDVIPALCSGMTLNVAQGHSCRQSR